MKPGTRLFSPVGGTSVVVVRTGGDVELTCAGSPLSAEGATGAEASSSGDEVLIGKRYVDEESGLELLCVKGGPGPLSVDGRLMTIKSAKQLPASD